MQSSKNIMSRAQLIFAIVLVCIIFGVVFFIFSQSRYPKTSTTIPTPTLSQNQQEVSPTGQTGFNAQDNRAITVVENLKEIQDEKKRAATSNIKLVTEIDSYPSTQDDFYIIHVYEIVPNGDGTAHTATFGWYRVDPQTSAVTKTEE